MLRGRFDEDGYPTLSVTLAGPLGQVTLTVVVDTGFDGDLCIPVPKAVSLGLQLKATKFVEFADGRVEEEFVFRGAVTMGDLPPRDVDVELTFSDQALIGSGLFQGLKLEINYERETVVLKPVRRSQRERS